MAKELPYFKFEPNQWENGKIQIFSPLEKGIFIELCCMYWSRLGDLSYKLAVGKICNGNATELDLLYEEKVFDIIDGNIYIKFLSEQLNEFEDTSKQNSKNAKEGWIKRRKQKEESELNATASNPQSERNAIREDKIKEDKIILDNKLNYIQKNQKNDFSVDDDFQDAEIDLIQEKKEKEKSFAKKEKEIDYDQVIGIFNNICHELPKVSVLSEKRKKMIKSRATDFGLEKIGDVIKKVSESSFLNGNNANGWKANFDWIFNTNNFVKILEDNYINKNVNKSHLETINRQTKEVIQQNMDINTWRR